jgi:alanyl-tRNA synthetase
MMRKQGETLDQIKGLLKGAIDLPKAIEALIEEKNQLQRKIESLENEKLQIIKTELLSKIQKNGDIMFIAEKVEVPSADSLRQLAYDLKKHMENAVVILGTVINQKPSLAVMIDEALVTEKNLNAGNTVREAAKAMKGGGGGQPHFATAGGSDAEGLTNAISKAKELIFG